MHLFFMRKIMVESKNIFLVFYPLKIQFLRFFASFCRVNSKRSHSQILGQSFSESINILVKESIDGLSETFFFWCFPFKTTVFDFAFAIKKTTLNNSSLLPTGSDDKIRTSFIVVYESLTL